MTYLRGLAAVFAAFVVALGFAPRAGASSGGMSPKPGAHGPKPAVTVTQVWSRPALAGDTGVIYATLSAAPHAGDRLLRVSSPVAATVELHESVPVRATGTQPHDPRPGGIPPDSSMMGMSMSPVTAVDVPAGGRALLAPGGYHVMLIGLHHPLVAGQVFAVTFEFERAGKIVAHSVVRA